MFNEFRSMSLFFVRMPSLAFNSFFSQSPSTKQHVSDGPQIKIRKRLTLQDTEGKFSCLMYYIFLFLNRTRLSIFYTLILQAVYE